MFCSVADWYALTFVCVVATSHALKTQGRSNPVSCDEHMYPGCYLAPDDTFSRIPSELLPGKSMFVFVHLEKSAGSTLGTLFQKAVGKNALIRHRNGPFTVPHKYFVVSSIRNPCSQCLSVFNYGCQNVWLLKNEHKWDISANPELEDKGECPTYHRASPSSKLEVVNHNFEGFQKSIQNEDLNCGDYESQINATFKWIGINRVDCWVRVEHLAEDAAECVKRYSTKTGFPVDYTVFQSNFRRNAGSDYGPCQSYYDTTSENHVRDKTNFLFDYFHYGTCCNDNAIDEGQIDD